MEASNNVVVMEKPEVKQKANNFLSDAISMIQELNKISGKELSMEEKNNVMEKLDEFSTSFIYFREFYDESKSKIRQLGLVIEDIRSISAIGEANYTNASDPDKQMDILVGIVTSIMDRLEIMNDLINQATVEESQNRQLNGIKEIFIETKKSIEGTETNLRSLMDKFDGKSDHLKDSMEAVETHLLVFENIAVDLKNQYDGIKQMEETILKAFGEWQNVAAPDISAGFDKMLENVNRTITEREEQQVAKVSEVDNAFVKTMESFKTQSNEVLEKIKSINQKTDNLLSGEGVKQFMVYGGTALSGLNLILLILLLFLK
ncbi:hypothetical protein [Acetobacterium wieringae]|uniref:hypothetical protein n=1 Tax=Acetobacterium wieringae TaxID=52694 RepID=UPI002B214785|nr:hypothetical protein [Acetobacterium wieringae]MEA4805003.1 hypothetical protein [Acetobacterium wieringae]